MVRYKPTLNFGLGLNSVAFPKVSGPSFFFFLSIGCLSLSLFVTGTFVCVHVHGLEGRSATSHVTCTRSVAFPAWNGLKWHDLAFGLCDRGDSSCFKNKKKIEERKIDRSTSPVRIGSCGNERKSSVCKLNTNATIWAFQLDLHKCFFYCFLHAVFNFWGIESFSFLLFLMGRHSLMMS